VSDRPDAGGASATRENDPVITVEAAKLLREAMERAEVTWTPAPGDRFFVPDRDFEEPFIVSEMVVEVRDLPSGRLIRFNGTTEWALDSVDAGEVVWVPWEHQLRELLGEDFGALERLPGEVEGYAVVLTDGSRHVDVDPERAYVHAVLGVLEAS
jgi:hypothetical protein